MSWSIKMKTNLLNRIINKNLGKYIFFPLDFGFYKSPTPDLLNMDGLIDNIVGNQFGTTMLHKGLAKTYAKKFKENDYPFFLHVTGSTGLYKTIRKVPVAGVEEAKELGAIGVSALIYLGNPYELEMLEMIAKISDRADKLGLLVYVMMYVADYHQDQFTERLLVQDIQYASHVGYELGLDIVETRFPEGVTDFQAIKSVCPIPLILGDRTGY